MEVKELRNKSDEELQKLLQDFKSKAVELKFNVSAGRVKNVHEMHQTKKDIARIYGLLKERTQATSIK